jgi:uncharacterized protein YciI
VKSLIALVGIALLFTAASYPLGINAQEQPKFVLGQFTVVLLRDEAGSKKPAPADAAQIIKDHVAYVVALSKAGKVVLAGHFTGPDNLHGILIFTEKSKDKVKEMAGADPIVKNGGLTPHIYTWYTDQNAFASSHIEMPFTLDTYYFAILRRGPKWAAESTPETQKLQQAHMDNIMKMQKEGKLSVAGPFDDAGDMAGIFIFKLESLEAAKALVATDPTVVAGRLVADVYTLSIAKGMLP